MRLSAQSTETAAFAHEVKNGISVFSDGLKRAPSQKELAGILRITTRQLRRWEALEEAENRPCSRPYNQADMWHLYERRGRRGWDRAFALRVGLAEVFERFDQMRCETGAHDASDDGFTIATMMLRCLASEGGHAVHGSHALPRALDASLVATAKTQLLTIINCAEARYVLVKAFFEAALIAETKLPSVQAEPSEISMLSA